MTGPEVERMSRPSSPSPSVPPTGDSTPLPPHIQGAERRTESRARHTGIRWGLRVLVVGGLAGAAWLLTGAAAQAADREDGPLGSLLGAVVDSDATRPVTGLLETAIRPLEAVRPNQQKHDVVADVLETPARLLSRPVVDDRAETPGEPDEEPNGTPVDSAISDVDGVLRDTAAPIRLTGGPADTRQLLSAVADDVADLSPAEERLREPAIPPAPAAGEPAPSRPERDTSLRTPVIAPKAVSPASHGKSVTRHVHRHPVTVHAVPAGPASLVEDDTPGGDGPAAPLRLRLGEVSGIPTGGSGTPMEGGAAAFLPAAIASSRMASHPLPIVSEVEAWRHDAEAPTVSPD